MSLKPPQWNLFLPLNTLGFFSVVAALVAGFGAIEDSAAQGTAFTYQGRLNNNSNVANGVYDFTFSLFNARDGAGQLGNTATNPGTGVSNGIFTVAIDFGANFPGADRWLEIGVRTNGSADFSALSPRQKLTPIPYAITAANVLPGASSLSGIYGGAVTMSNSANVFAGTFSGNGVGITNLPRASEILVARNYGAVGNGIADDTAALQAAIDAANRQTNFSSSGYNPGGTELQLEAGIYRTTAPLWIRGQNGLKISGLGGIGQCTLINYYSDIFIVTNAANAWSQEPNDLIIQGLSLKSLGYSVVGIRFCAAVNTSDGMDVHDCYFSGFDKAIFAIGDGSLGGVSNSRFENLDVYDNRFGLVFTNGLFNANRVEGAFVGNSGASLVIHSGTWDIALRDSGGLVGATPTTNILWITGSPKIILRGGQSEYYGASNAAAILATGGGGYDLLCDGVTLNDFTGGRPWAGTCWSVDLEDSGIYASFVHFQDCRFSIANTLYTGSPFVKITHSDVQRVTASGPRVVAGYFFYGYFVLNFMLQADPICITDNSANIMGQGSIFWGFKEWLVTNGVPKLFMNTSAGLLRVDAADAFDAGSLSSGILPTARLSTNVARLNLNQSFSTNVSVGGVFEYAAVISAPENNSTLLPASSYVRLIHFNGAVTLNATAAIGDGAGVGAMLILEGTSDVNTVTIPNAAHTRLAGGVARTLGARDTLSLLWNGTEWLELSYSNN